MRTTYHVWFAVYTHITVLYPRSHLPDVLSRIVIEFERALIHKAPTLSFTAFSITAVLLIVSPSLVFAQGDRSESERQSPEKETQAESLFQNALVLFDNRESESARLRLQEAMHLWVQMREPGKAAKAALQMGDRCKQAKDYQDALNYYRQALDIKLLPGAVRANALNAIALIYAELYLRDLAARYFNQALDQARIINDLPAQRVALTGLADLYRQQGALEEALAFVTKALRLSKKDNADADPALLYLKGLISQEQGLVDNAKGAFAEALAIYRSGGNVAGQVKALCALSTLSLLVSQNQAGLEQAERAVELAEGQAKRVVSFGDEVNARELRWRASLSRARAERALGQKKSALKSYFWAISHFKAMWWEFYIATENSALAFREEAQAAYREYIDLSMEQGQFKEAYELADEAKARVTLNLTTVRRGQPPSVDIKQAATLRELSRSIARLRLQLLASGLSREQQAKLQKEIEEAEYKMQETRLQAEMKHSRERLVWSQLADADQLQKQMGHDQMALAEFSLGENRSFVWLFTHGEFFFEILPARKEIEKAVRTYLDMLSATPNHLYIERELAKLREQSEALFATLFGRLSRQIERDPRLIIVPDGPLHYLPFEALIHSGRYLVEDHEISYNPSASMLVQRQDSKGDAENVDRMELLAFGDPIFSSELKASVRKKHKSAPIDVIRSSRASHGFQMPPLPRTRDEVQYIASLFPPDRTQLYLGKDSTEDAVKRVSLRRYRRLHFATHSLVDETSPSRSAVVLTLDTDPEEDGFLEVNEISELDLDCDLVVLSACQTGRGRLLSGEGVVGLTRAFLYAGARSVVVSLWSVSDISTGHLMKSFYQRLAGNFGNAAALRLAKLQMLQGPAETRHPYYWAPFIVVGKP
jgi:CHAT domain-containing protein